MHEDATWYKGRPRPGQQCVRCGPSSPMGHSPLPHFSAHVCCGQTAGWIQMPHGRKVGLSPCHIALHGGPALPLLQGTAPLLNFRPLSFVAKRSPISATAEHLFSKCAEHVVWHRTVLAVALQQEKRLYSTLRHARTARTSCQHAGQTG